MGSKSDEYLGLYTNMVKFWLGELFNILHPCLETQSVLCLNCFCFITQERGENNSRNTASQKSTEEEGNNTHSKQMSFVT